MISGVSSSASSGLIIARSEKPHRGFRPRRRGLRRASTARTPRTHRALRHPTYDLTSNAPVGQIRRVGKKVNGTLANGWLYQDQLRPVAQLDGTGTNVVAQFVYGSKPNVPDYMVTSRGTYRILSDHLGSPRAVVDVSSGNLIETINFDEFGNETDTLAGTLPTGYVRIPFGFAGGLYDPDTGLVRFGARDYDASVGRWTAKDPIGFNGGNNQYIYVLNDPVNAWDQDGMQSCACGEGASAAFYVGPWDAWLAYRDAKEAEAEASAARPKRP
jgi:RHS repeat-associated protein